MFNVYRRISQITRSNSGSKRSGYISYREEITEKGGRKNLSPFTLLS